MEAEELRVDFDCEMTWVHIKVTGAYNLYVGAFYRPPNTEHADKSEYLAQLDTCLSQIPEIAHVCLGENFNWRTSTGQMKKSQLQVTKSYYSKAVKATVQKKHLRNKKVFRIYVLLLYCYL